MTDTPHDMAPPAGWEGLLTPGERILWQGRPKVRFRWSLRMLGQVAFGLVFMGVPLSVLFFGSGASEGGIALGGVLFGVFGAAVAGHATVWRIYEYRQTWYTLTTRRAVIAKNLFGMRRLDSYSIDRSTEITLEDGRNGAVYFAKRRALIQSNDEFGPRMEPVGFENLEDPRAPYQVMRQMQGGAV